MKKLIAILMALVLALTLGCTFAAAEDDSVPPSTPEMKAYESAWISEDGQTLVWIGRQDDGFQIEAVQTTGENAFTSWQYLSNFDAETKSIKDAQGIKGDYKVTEEGKDERIEGSSAARTTRPPLTPVMALFTNASAQTFIPTCFMHTRARFPAYDIPRAASIAVFSFVHQRLRMPRSRARGLFWMNSVISVEGVPG